MLPLLAQTQVHRASHPFAGVATLPKHGEKGLAMPFKSWCCAYAPPAAETGMRSGSISQFAGFMDRCARQRTPILEFRCSPIGGRSSYSAGFVNFST
jgi:hypothetical protein